MLSFTKKRTNSSESHSGRLPGFEYLDQKFVNLDSACQTMRPQPVIDKLNQYYHEFNSCGDRVQYDWGKTVDHAVSDTRQTILKYLELSKKDYAVSFTLNTTYGINLLLSQLPRDGFDKIVTSEIEHNSVFLPTITYAKTHNLKRLVLKRDKSGNLIYKPTDIENAIIVVNTTSNIDGRLLHNLPDLVKDAHRSGGIVICDAAQTMACHHDLLKKCSVDAICFSAHKMYSASLGVVVAKKSLLDKLQLNFVGGGMVSQVRADDFDVLPEPNVNLEPGLQAYGEIVALKEAINWLEQYNHGQRNNLSHTLFDGLREINGFTTFNQAPSSIVSGYFQGLDSNLVAEALSDANIMVRSGYFCCHYYLITTLHMPKMLRFSLGLHNNQADIDKLLATMQQISKGLKK